MPCSRAMRAAATLPSIPRSPKPPGIRMPSAPSSALGRVEVLGVDQLDLDLDAVVEAAVAQRLDHRLVGVRELHVLADERDLDPGRLARRAARADHRLPLAQVGRGRLHAEVVEHEVVDALGAEDERHLVDVVDVAGGDDRLDRAGWRTARSSCGCRGRARSSERQISTCGWMPMRRSSLTECWVGFVFSSPAWPM